MKLVPLNGGNSIIMSLKSHDNPGFPSGDPAEFIFHTDECIPINTYTAEVTLNNTFYKADVAEDVFVVYDPSLGFTTGGGWFYWPGTSDKTNFGFTMKYNKKATNVQGNLLVIRHLSDGSGIIYRIKSNMLEGLAITSTEIPGKASFGGKCIYKGPDSLDVNPADGFLDNMGGLHFTCYVEDGDNPGEFPDIFWFSVLGMEFSLDGYDPVIIEGGNIVVPHTPGNGGGDDGDIDIPDDSNPGKGRR